MTQDSWTDDEAQRLIRHFTNLDRDVFGLTLPAEIAGALFSRYSRSNKSLRRTFLDEFAAHPDLPLARATAGAEAGPPEEALKRAREFYDRVLVGYGDDSVAQLGGAHLACEGISNLAANLLEDARIGIAPLEKSTRYVRFDQRDAAGRYAYYREPRILASEHAGAYVTALDGLFETYARLMEPVLGFVRERLPIEQVEFKHPRTGEPLGYAATAADAKLRAWLDSAYRATVRAQACDILRGLLPVATLTNVGLYGNGQAFEYLLTKLYSHPLAEMRALAGDMHRELNQLIPSFIRRAARSDYLAAVRTGTALAAAAVAGDRATHDSGVSVRLIAFDGAAEDKILAALLFPRTTLGLGELLDTVRAFGPDERTRLLEACLSQRRHRRDKPGRALENASYTFEVTCNIGSYRDLHRHRILTQERQDFTVLHGYDLPSEIIEMGQRVAFETAIEAAAAVWTRLAPAFPEEAQYLVPFAHRVRWYLTANLRELYHLVELRTMPQGHPDYRLVAQELWRQVKNVHPHLAFYAKFVDWNAYRLGRLQSELRTEFKKSSQS